MVQTVKRALRKYGLQKGHLGDWDIQLPWLAMGYRFSRQASLASFSPYFLLYGRDPDLPTAIRRDSSEVVSLDDPNMWVRVCSQRVVLFRRVMPAAFENLAIAQHNDTLRYATIRGEGYQPSIRRFRVGDYLLFTADCTDYVGCDGRTHYLASARDRRLTMGRHSTRPTGSRTHEDTLDLSLRGDIRWDAMHVETFYTLGSTTLSYMRGELEELSILRVEP
ncbi:hypothetical protein AXG93_2619s1080 [Marchantia polymorpha subsp. ruderalis]|uniref:Uncharacterized protein n=1 Tax=Marchantia polymorpha subsp. ruderalis TaxID=1480154 RepID=A0A176VL62_MARPO|nr:hypothetical protein AXG93_2619s1080 [Marchantia polymorpha subsp. ruderalis]